MFHRNPPERFFYQSPHRCMFPGSKFFHLPQEGIRNLDGCLHMGRCNTKCDCKVAIGVLPKASRRTLESQRLLFVPLRVEHAFFINAAVSMSAKIIALRLQQIGREALLAVAVNVAQRVTERRDWRAQV